MLSAGCSRLEQGVAQHSGPEHLLLVRRRWRLGPENGHGHVPPACGQGSLILFAVGIYLSASLLRMENPRVAVGGSRTFTDIRISVVGSFVVRKTHSATVLAPTRNAYKCANIGGHSLSI